jgi:DNA-binding HxlR family transcriptional regulator
MKTECLKNSINHRGKTYPCTVSLTMDFIGGKWKAVILYHLKDHEKRYNELRKEMPAITEMTLSLQLKQLEQDGFGKTLLPVLDAITNWGNRTIEQEVAVLNGRRD